MSVEEMKMNIESSIDVSKAMVEMNKKALGKNKNYNAKVWIKYYENELKFEKLILLGLTTWDTSTEELCRMIREKKKQCLFNKVEIAEEMVECGEINEGLYLEMANDSKRFFC